MVIERISLHSSFPMRLAISGASSDEEGHIQAQSQRDRSWASRDVHGDRHQWNLGVE
jgi:hypothetical protein